MTPLGVIITMIGVAAVALILWALWLSIKHPGRGRSGSSDGFIYTSAVGDSSSCTTDGGGGCSGD